MRRPVVALLAIVVLVAGCGDEASKTPVPSDVSDWESDEQLQQVVSNLPEEEQQLFGAYTARTVIGQAFGGEGIPEGMTVRDVVDAQRAWNREQELEEERRQELTARVETERVEALRRMNQALTVSLVSLKYREENWAQDRYMPDFTIEIAFENHTDKDLVGVKGVTVFKDVFGDVIQMVTLSNDNDIPAGSTEIWHGVLDYNQFDDEDRKLRTTPFEKLKFEWEPEVYIFAHGTEMRMPMLPD